MDGWRKRVMKNIRPLPEEEKKNKNKKRPMSMTPKNPENVFMNL